jgi:outer membrane protein
VPYWRYYFGRYISVRAVKRHVREAPRGVLSTSVVYRVMKVAMLCLAGFGAPAQAASMFGEIDPLNVKAMTSPAANQPWTPGQPLPQVSAPEPLSEVPNAALSGPLSLADLTDLALLLNPRTRQAWFLARAEAATVGIEEADKWPTINGLYSHRVGRVISGTTGLPVPVQTFYGPNVSLSYVLYDFGQREADIVAAKYRLLAANLSQNRVLQEVANQVEQAYYRVLAFDYLVRASRESLKNFETAFDAAQRRRSSGLATAGDEYRAETQVGQSRLVLTRNEGELSKARGQLANAVGLPASFPLQLKPVSDRPPVSEIMESMEALLQKAKASRPDLIAAEARALAARASALAASRAGLPSLEFVANYGRVVFTNGGIGPNNTGTGIPRTEQDVYQLGFNLRIPIFSGFRDTYTKRRAEEVAAQAETARDQLVSQTELEVWQAYYDLQTSASSVASTANLVKSATESAAAAAARYKGGVGSLLDFITAQLDDTNARVQEIQSFLDWYSALARLNFALGASDTTIFKTKTP